MGRSERRELAQRVSTVIEHLFKLEHARATPSGAGWRETIRRSRGETLDLLDDNPSLRALVPTLIQRAQSRAMALAEQSLADHADQPVTTTTRRARGYAEAEIQDDWWPDPARDVG